MAITDNIVGCWSPSVRGSGYLLPDLSGKGNHGTLTNMAGDDWVGASVRGVSGRVLDCDGSNDYITIGKSLQFAGSAMTVSAWVRTTNASAFQTVINQGSTTNQFLLYWGTTSWVMRGAGGLEATFGSLTAGVWTHVAAVWNGGIGTGYLQGVFSGSGAISQAAANLTTNLYLGTYAAGAGNFPWTGQMGEIVFYNRALTAGEIAELYRRGNGAIGRELTGQTRRRVYGFVPAGFKAYWVQQKSQIIGGGV